MKPGFKKMFFKSVAQSMADNARRSQHLSKKGCLPERKRKSRRKTLQYASS
jgi:hypothetical protein